ncbi:COMM domain-containing protein 10 [Cimex lectularius]|uniref:COMM domain-containing protein n=1 Tax=Cimex lectularius TaxID=79782 RepID=A0A8I6RFN9_CIMLE|nr:COMM domain-containing protein 10 [Cimex lectularius]
MDEGKSWISLTPNIQQGVEIINNVDSKKYQLLLQRVVQEMLINQDSYKPFTDEEEEKLLASLSLDRKELELLIYTSIIILNQAVYSLPSPDILHAGLINSLRLDEEKALVFVTVLKTNSKKLYLKLKQKSIYSRKLEDVSWLVNIEIASHNEKEKFTPKAILQFKLKDPQGPSSITVDANETSLMELFKSLEQIQESLDALA